MALVKGTYLVLGNWKMHLTRDAARHLARRIASANAAGVDVGLAPAFVHIQSVREAIAGSEVLLGAQTCHAQPEGAFTGEVSAPMLADMGCAFVILGHSERRQMMHESDAAVKAKAEAALAQGLHVVLCVGETLGQRESGAYREVIEGQLHASLPDAFDRDRLTVSYEPIWAIGTGRTASLDDISAMHAHIGEVLASRQGGGALPRVLYGGSVKANNALDILSLPVVDGVLVGGASLDADAFTTIIGAAGASAQKR